MLPGPSAPPAPPALRAPCPPRPASEASATPPTSSAAAHHCGPRTGSPRNSAADDIPKTGTSSENGATVEAGWRFSSHPHAPKPKTVVTQAT
ncbi:hypothetical protein GCM10010358_18170 [Streptomyces minutiscleroticus]|uniref:Uncharacterized protein n=1 Tax=Streptomyces minutiscleroticus TaxID=68238 RepID=A0A918NEC7_9ACTN|nr:hypothetical protein GCM10010358_18170 [Streptomyces minutiscleroticus]